MVPSASEIKPVLLKIIRNRKEHALADVLQAVADHFGLSTRLTRKRQECGKETVLQNRLRWARWELLRDGKVVTTRRGFFKLA